MWSYKSEFYKWNNIKIVIGTLSSCILVCKITVHVPHFVSGLPLTYVRLLTCSLQIRGPWNCHIESEIKVVLIMEWDPPLSPLEEVVEVGWNCSMCNEIHHVKEKERQLCGGQKILYLPLMSKYCIQSFMS